MHRGTAFVIIKDENNEFKVLKSTEFNGSMGIDYYGESMFEMLSTLDDSKEFDKMIREFDKKFFEYGDEVMTYLADEESTPYIDKNGYENFDYSLEKNQFRFFSDFNGKYIYTSDSNYIKNMTDEDISVVCNNGVYIVKPNQILVSDYDECINNIKETFGEKINSKINLETLDIGEYISTKREKILLDNILNTFKEFDFKVSLLSENGINNGIEIETWTDGGVDMIHTICFFDKYINLYDEKEIKKELEKIYENFSIDEEIDLYRQNREYKECFTIRESLEDFEKYKERLKDISKEFENIYHKLIYQKVIEKDCLKELM